VGLRARLLLGFGYVLLLAIVSLEVPLALSLRDRVDHEVRAQARDQAQIVASAASELVDPPALDPLDRLVETAADTAGGRVLVLDARGRVLADSAGASGRGESYGDRPEIAAALGGASRQQVRYSQSVGRDLLATAVPIVDAGRTAGVVRVTQSTEAAGAAVDRIVLALALLGVVVMVVGLGAAALIARGIARPIVRLQRAAQGVASGDLDTRAPEEGSREQVALARAFNEMTARVARMIAVQREFVADASHQLRTPLTGVRLRIEEAQAAHLTPEVARELDAATAEVDRLAAIVDELLVLSRAGERDAPPERQDLAEVVRAAATRWAPVADRAGVALEVVDEDGAGAFAPRRDVERALDAMVENAIRYAPSGTVVELAAAPGRIEVRDRGPGLEPGEEEQVWARFHRGRAGRASPGSGLGLTIARELARAWGGEATLADRPGGGAVAVLWLPVASPEREEAPA